MCRFALFSAVAVAIAGLGCGSNIGGPGTTPAGSGGAAAGVDAPGAGTGGNGGTEMGSGGAASGGGGTGGAAVNDGGASGGSTDANVDTVIGPAVDAGPWDPNSVGGASKCAQSSFQLCEDFESGAIDKTIWTVTGTAPVIDDVHVARGSKAMHIAVTGGASTRLRETKTFREPDDTYFGRVFIYFKSIPTPTGGLGYSHWTLLGATGDGPGGGGEIRFGAQMLNGVNLWGTGTDNQSAGGTGDWTNVDQDPAPDGKAAHVPTGVWLCLEWMHAGPTTNETKIWIDGVEHPSIATTKTSHGTRLTRGAPSAGMGDFVLPNFTALWIGWQTYSGAQPYELWMDEIAINHTRIGCGN